MITEAIQQPLFPSASKQVIEDIAVLALQADEVSEDDPLAALSVLIRVEEQLKVARKELVHDARRRDFNWVQIGQAMNMTRQAVHGAYAKDAPEPIKEKE